MNSWLNIIKDPLLIWLLITVKMTVKPILPSWATSTSTPPGTIWASGNIPNVAQRCPFIPIQGRCGPLLLPPLAAVTSTGTDHHRWPPINPLRSLPVSASIAFIIVPRRLISLLRTLFPHHSLIISPHFHTCILTIKYIMYL